MGSIGIVIVTATKATSKDLTRFLTHIRDWEFRDEDDGRDSFTLLTSTKNPPQSLEIAKPPISDFDQSKNDWLGKSIEQVEEILLPIKSYLFEHERDNTVQHWSALMIVLDDQGLEDQTCVALEQRTSFDEDEDEDAEFSYLDSFKKVRLPWDQVYISWCNIDIANMDFEDYCVDNEEKTADHWFEYDMENRYENDKEGIKERDEILEKYAKEGLI